MQKERSADLTSSPAQTLASGSCFEAFADDAVAPPTKKS